MTSLGNLERQRPVTRAEVDVLAERRRQIAKEGWSEAHDDDHNQGELAQLAALYSLTHVSFREGRPARFNILLDFFSGVADWFKPKDYRSNLVRASALIIAEIERLDRAEQSA